jgi:heat shock protein HtpX
VLAHEFGHYHGGDVALAPWIYKTRVAIGRTIERLSSNVLRAIFISYGNLFLRITHAVSRRQEFIADEVAARTIGGAPMASGLRRVHGAAIAHGSYWATEVAPLLASGYVASISEGFERYLRSPHITEVVAAMVTQEEATGEANQYDTHPALRERLSALSSLPQGTTTDGRPATALLRDLEGWERRLLVATSRDYQDLKRIAWSDVAALVYVPLWRKRVERHGRLLAGCTIASVPATHEALVHLGAKVLQGAANATDEVRLQVGGQLLVGSIALALTSLGWTAEVVPGGEVVLRRNGHEFRPVSELADVMAGRESLDRWRQRCTDLGIAGVVIGKPVVATT